MIKKVKSKDLEYFSSTERVISLVGALEYIGLDSPDITNLLVEVAIALIDKSGKKDFYNENEWVEPTVDGRLEVSIEVSKFISFINAYIAKQEFPKEVDFEDDLRKEERKSHSSEEIKAILEKSFEYFIKNNYFSESVMNSIRNIINRSHKAGSDAVKKYMTSGMFETTDNELVYKIYVRELNKICEEVDYYNSMTSPEMLED